MIWMMIPKESTSMRANGSRGGRKQGVCTRGLSAGAVVCSFGSPGRSCGEESENADRGWLAHKHYIS